MGNILKMRSTRLKEDERVCKGKGRRARNQSNIVSSSGRSEFDSTFYDVWFILFLAPSSQLATLYRPHFDKIARNIVVVGVRVWLAALHRARYHDERRKHRSRDNQALHLSKRLMTALERSWVEDRVTATFASSLEVKNPLSYP